MPSTLVNVAEDAEMRLVSLLAPDDAGFQRDCEALISSGDATKLVAKLMTRLDQLVQSNEATSALTILVALLNKSNDNNNNYTKTLQDAIVQAHNCLKGDAIPDMADDCDYCRYIEAVEAHILT